MSENRMDFRILWGRFPSDTLHAYRLRSTIAIWQGVREPETYLLWMASAANSDAPLVEGSFQQRDFTPLQSWGDPEAPSVRIANFVLRETDASVTETLMPQIVKHMDAVVSRAGCLGSRLLSESNCAANLLGVTYWDHLTSFEAYAGWASEHPWRDTINPATRAVPLRLLTTSFAPAL
jgi:hypothetical protein